MQILAQGALQKMRTELTPEGVVYKLPVGDQEVPMNELIGKPISLAYQGRLIAPTVGVRPTRALTKAFVTLVSKAFLNAINA